MASNTRMDLTGAPLPSFRVGNNLLERPAPSTPTKLSEAQAQIDGLTDRFLAGATDWRLFAAFTAGAAAYPLGRLGIFSFAEKIHSVPLKVLSIAGGLSTEVFAFEFTHRSLQSDHRHLWKWSGGQGLRKVLLQSLVGFCALKGLGHLGRTENTVVQHLLQDAGLVFSHRATAALGMAPPVPGNLAEEFVEAE